MRQRHLLAHLALFFGCMDAMAIVELATSLGYPMPNTDNCCTWPGVRDDHSRDLIRWSKILYDPRSMMNNKNVTGFLNTFTFATTYPALVNLVLYGCTKISGALLNPIFLLPSIERVDLSYTGIDGIIDFPGFTPSPTLKYMLIEGANLSGNFPKWLDKAPNLAYIKLGGNKLTGELPANLGTLLNLVELNIYNNLLNGTIPIEYASLSELRIMRIGNNQFSGAFPDDFFANMANLNTFEASNTELTGTIPSSLAARSSLELLILPNAKFYGPLPLLAGSLTYLDVTGNSFSGTVPEWIMQKFDLQTLTLAGTNLTGTLPPLDSLTKLEVLSLANTQISGPLPKIGSPKLTVVKLFNTLLSGCWDQEDLTVVTCSANNTQLCCAPQACLPLEATCVPDDSTFSEPVVITTIVFTENTTMTMTTGATITVTSKDCIEFDGKLIIEIDYATLNLTYDEVVLMYYACRNSTFDEVEFKQINQPACLTDQPQIQYNPSQLSLVLPKANQCGPNASIPDWAIAVIVVGGLIIVTGVLLLALYYSPMREKVFPYARK